MINRYRSYGAQDDSPIQDGDTFFIGANYYDSKENLSPGQVQAATNIDFTKQNADTRGGFVCLPELGAASFNSDTGWTSRTSAASANWQGVAYGNGRFVATVGQGGTGSNDVMYSLDGVTWVLVSSGYARNWRAVTYGASLFVAVGTSGGNNVMTSPDGVTWTLRTSPATTYNWGSVVYGSNLFVAVAYSSGTTDQVMTSPNGITWTLRTGTPGTGGSGWNGVTYGNGVYVAVGDSGVNTAMSSTDGITWTARTPAAACDAVAYGNGRFAAVTNAGSTQQAMTSDDGITWTLRTTIGSGLTWKAITYGNGTFVAVNSDGVASTAIMTSPDGITWTAAAAPNTQTWFGIAYGNGTFVAVPFGGGAALMTKTYYTTPNTTGTVLAKGVYSDPNDEGSRWIMLVGANEVGFYSFGRTSRSVAINSSYSVTALSTVVQCDNKVYLFRGSDATPLYWDGNWSGEFTIAPTPTPGAGFSIIPNSDQAVYHQNRLWIKNGKDTVSASGLLDFEQFDDLSDAFTIDAGSSDYIVTSYPFGTATLIVFKNNSIFALNNTDGGIGDVTSTEITRQVGAIGINTVVSVGPDLVYMSSRNINLLSLTSTNNAIQHKTLPLSRNIQAIIDRVNWEYGYKVSMGYFDNKLYVALPLDNATACSSVVIYNFITEQWYGEWNFNSSLAMSILGWEVADYLGLQRLHCITEDGRIFVVGEGYQDISGTNVYEISTSLTTRAYRAPDEMRVNRRVYLDIGTWRPMFSVTAYADGAAESTEILSDQTYARSASWVFNDSTYSLTNSGDNYNRAGRKDYSGLCSESIQAQSGFYPEMLQEIRLPIPTRRRGRLHWVKVENTQGRLVLGGVGTEARTTDRGSLVQVI